MANTWFQFKQFTIYQDKCSHKVGTDSILLGSWVNLDNVTKAFDIGSGCGILSLMIAQRNPNVKIFGVEIDNDSFNQALVNINQSPWADRISILNTSLQKFGKNRYKYDLIITNPPYFINSLPSPNSNRNIARHAHTLTLHEIIHFTQNHLEPNGRLALIIPTQQFRYFKEIVTIKNFFIYRITKVFPNYNKDSHRMLIECGKEKRGFEYDELVIESNQRHVYTKKYAELTKDFYLNINVEETELVDTI